MADSDEALRLRRSHPGWLALGERFGRPLAGFDCGNSPTELRNLDLRGRTLVHTTHAGTQGLVAARGAGVVLTGALVNAGALCRYLLRLAPGEVWLVRMGVAARDRSDADDLCAELLAARLTGAPSASAAQIRARLRGSAEAQKFFDPRATWAPELDFELCTELDRFDFVLRLSAESGFLQRVQVPQYGVDGPEDTPR
jgi:2-phosphosulfolactate phosphatase